MAKAEPGFPCPWCGSESGHAQKCEALLLMQCGGGEYVNIGEYVNDPKTTPHIFDKTPHIFDNEPECLLCGVYGPDGGDELPCLTREQLAEKVKNTMRVALPMEREFTVPVPKDPSNPASEYEDITIERCPTHVGWAVHSGAGGDTPGFVAFVAGGTEARAFCEKLIEAQEPVDPAEPDGEQQNVVFDGCVTPAVLVGSTDEEDHGLFIANHTPDSESCAALLTLFSNVNGGRIVTEDDWLK